MAERIVIPGDAGGLQGIAALLRTAAGEVSGVRDRVASNGLDGAWSGRAAEAFRGTLHELPGELAKIVSSFEQAAGAIGGFARRLEELQREADWYNGKLAESESEQRLAHERLLQAEGSVTRARAAHGAAGDPATALAARNALAESEARLHGATGAVEEAGLVLGNLVAGASGPRSEYEAAVRQCCGELDAAHHSASQGLLGWFGRHLHSFESGLDHLAGAAWHSAGEGLHDLEEDGKHLLSWAGHELDKHWEQIRTVLDYAGAAIGVVALAAILVGSGGTALPFVLAAAGAADAALMMGGDAYEGRLPQNEEDRKRLWGDAFGLVTSLFAATTAFKAMGAADDAAEAGGAAKDVAEAGGAAKDAAAAGGVAKDAAAAGGVAKDVAAAAKDVAAAGGVAKDVAAAGKDVAAAGGVAKDSAAAGAAAKAGGEAGAAAKAGGEAEKGLTPVEEAAEKLEAGPAQKLLLNQLWKTTAGKNLIVEFNKESAGWQQTAKATNDLGHDIGREYVQHRIDKQAGISERFNTGPGKLIDGALELSQKVKVPILLIPPAVPA